MGLHLIHWRSRCGGARSSGPPEVKRLRRPGIFVAVGAAASAVHWSVAVSLVERAQLAPTLANAVGWLAALCVSFAGHRWLTFGDRAAPPLRSALRFFVVSASAFAINAAAYALLLRTGWVRYDVGLVIVLLGVATLTYLASRHWAFRPR
jgi:putative flippase GtrA